MHVLLSNAIIKSETSLKINNTITMIKTKTIISVLLIILFAGITSCKKKEVEEPVDEIETGIEKGNMAPDFTLMDVNNNNRSLSDYKGKLVVLQFWASWCHFCKIENPELVALLNNYNDKGFEILGISLDTKKSNWLDGIEHENLNFVNLSDLKGFDSPIANTYAINSIPQMYLVDEEGVIILITNKASDVTNKVEQHY